MGKVIVLIALGPNNIEIPCRIFPDFETGKQRCDEIFGFEGKELKKDGEHRVIYNQDLDDMSDESIEISDKLFTRWYYGCGGAYRFVLMEVEYDIKFVGFDLD